MRTECIGIWSIFISKGNVWNFKYSVNRSCHRSPPTTVTLSKRNIARPTELFTHSRLEWNPISYVWWDWQWNSTRQKQLDNLFWIDAFEWCSRRLIFLSTLAVKNQLNYTLHNGIHLRHFWAMCSSRFMTATKLTLLF